MIATLTVLAAATAHPLTNGTYGGVLTVIDASGEPDALDPTTSSIASAGHVYSAICRALYHLNADNELVPDLATAMPTISADKLTYTVPIRRGVVFNDGTPFNAQAVLTTLQRDQTLPGSRYVSALSYIDSATAPDPSTVVFHLKSRYSPLPYVLNFPIMSPTQLQKLGTNFASDPICVGPFMYDHRVAGDNVTVIKSPYYYDKYAVHFDKIVFKYQPDTAAAAAALMAGDAQVLTGVAATQLPAVQQDSALRVISQNSLNRGVIFFNIGNKNGIGTPPVNVGTPLATSPKLREAFEEAIDRTTYNRVVNNGLQHPDCTFIPFGNTAWYGPTKVPCTPYDPADAKKLVAASGIPNPTVHLLTATATSSLLGAQFIQSEEAAVGINVVIDSVDLPTAAARANGGNYDAFLIGFTAGVDPGPDLLSVFGTQGSANNAGYSSPRLDLIIANGFKATSTKARETLYRVAQQVIQTDRPWIVLTHGVTYAAVSNNVMLGDSTFDDYVFGQYKS
jgi:peptide/nickel transport system substrate-binding protein